MNTEYDEDRSKLKSEKRDVEDELQSLRDDFEKFKAEKAIEDLLVVKLDIDTIDDGLLLDKQTKIEDLENEKIKLESRISLISDQYHLVLSD
jgi:predicted  nucleic acid-binding Zn-ribbon protein